MVELGKYYVLPPGQEGRGSSGRCFLEPSESDGALSKHVHPQAWEGLHAQPGDRPHLPSGAPLSQPHHPLATPRHRWPRSNSWATCCRGTTKRSGYNQGRRGSQGWLSVIKVGHHRSALQIAHTDTYLRKLRSPSQRKNITHDYNLVPVFPGRTGRSGCRSARSPRRKGCGALPVHVMQGVQRLVREHAQAEDAA